MKDRLQNDKNDPTFKFFYDFNSKMIRRDMGKCQAENFYNQLESQAKRYLYFYIP